MKENKKVTVYQEQNCGSCKFITQGKNCCYCGHEKQTDEDLKNYTYWSFGTKCELFEPFTPLN